jgi:hypothetical protein
LGLALDEPNAAEIPTQINGFDVLISDDVRYYANGSRVDYTSTPYDEGFVVNTGYAGC